MSDRFRATHRDLTEDEKAMIKALKDKAAELESLIENAPLDGKPGGIRYRALALTALEESIMWIIKGITL